MTRAIGVRLALVAILCLCFTARGLRADGEPEPAERASGGQPEAPVPEEPRPADSEFTERVVVSASATVQTVRDAPAAVDVIEGEELEARPGDQLVDHLRRVPGINVVQFSARDVNVASRSSTGGINNSTLVLADGRGLYQDFLGFVMWEFAPADLSLVERVEVVRGPASALWGANAVGGLIHVFTKSPRDTLGGKVDVEGGSYSTRRITAHESFLAGPWAIRLSGSLYEADPFERPETLTNFFGETIDPTLGLIDEDFRDAGTQQPRLDARADWRGGGSDWILQSGWARSRGWIMTGLGPFDVDPSTSLSYVQARQKAGPFESSFSVNLFDGNALNLINAIPFAFTSTTTEASFRGRSLVAARGVLGFGLELGRSTYDLSIAPEGKSRTRGGIFGELNLELAERWHLIAGARLDHFRETIGTVFSPRVALRFKPSPAHTLRVAAGRAFRSPSVIETDLRVPAIPVALLDWEQIDKDEVGFPFFAFLAELVCQDRPDNCGAPPGETPDYVAVTAARGSREIEVEQTDSLELGWAGRVGAFELSAAIYHTRSRDGIDFLRAQNYGVGPDGQAGTADDVLLPSDPDGDGIDEAPPVDVCPYVDGLPPFETICMSQQVPYTLFLSFALDGLVPSLFQYGNGSRVENNGLELGLRWDGPRDLSGWLNYSWQSDPRSDGIRMTDRIATAIAERTADADLDGDGVVVNTNGFVNIPAEQRVSLGAQIDRRRWFGSATVDYVARTFWQDVQTDAFWGWVPSYSLIGVRGGWRWPERDLELSAQVTNLLDEQVQQHILGDIIGRRATLTLSWSWENGAAGPSATP